MTTLKVPIAPDDHVQGLEDAAVTLVEYGDYECPHCGRAYPIVKQIQEKFGEQLRFVFRNFPLAELHPHAMQAAEIAEFAGTKGRYWEMHDLLFENQRHFSESSFAKLAHQLELPAEAVRDALQQGTYVERIRSEFRGGVRSGVNGTPTFFINGRRHDDSFEFETLSGALYHALGIARSRAS